MIGEEVLDETDEPLTPAERRMSMAAHGGAGGTITSRGDAMRESLLGSVNRG